MVVGELAVGLGLGKLASPVPFPDGALGDVAELGRRFELRLDKRRNRSALSATNASLPIGLMVASRLSLSTPSSRLVEVLCCIRFVITQCLAPALAC